MTGPVVGRTGELATVQRLLADTAAGSPTVVLLGGDAGVGKTTFARRVVQLAQAQGYQALVGACLSVESGVPFAPVVEALRPALADRPEVLGPAGATLRGLLPGTPVALPAGQVLDLLLSALAHLAATAPVLLVLEDMHWADPSTRELTVHLARNLRGPVCLLLSYRSDDLHRRHPLRASLAELGRSARAERIELGPLDRAGLAELVANLSGEPAEPAAVGELLARSGGNPLFAEELVAAGPCELPARLADLLLARIDALSEGTAQMLRLASAGGARVDTALLARVLDQTPEQVDAAAREAVDFNVLAIRAGSLEFRHELLREAAYDDLLPGERARVHGRLAAAMEAREGVATMNDAAQTAYHWGAANQLPKALLWSMRAGELASRLAVPEAAGHLDRVLELWEMVPEAEQLVGVPHAEVLLLAARAAEMTGQLERALALVDRASDEVGDADDRLLASRVYGLRGSFCGGVGDSVGRSLAVDRAVELAEGPPSVELAGALAVKATRLGYDFQLEQALVVGARAVQVAQQAGSPAEESNARLALGWAMLHSGDVDGGLAHSRRAVEFAQRDYDIANAAATLAYHLFVAGRPEEALQVSADAARTAAALGLRWVTSFCVNQRVEALLWTGRWDAAELSLREMVDLERGSYAGTTPGTSRLFDGLLRLFRGDLDGAVLSLTAVRGRRLDDFSAGWEAAGWLARAYAAQSRPEALALAVGAANAVSDRQGAYPGGFAASTLLSTMFFLGSTDADAFALAEQTIRRAATGPAPAPGTLPAAHLASARAWATTVAGRPDPGAWASAVDAWERPGYAFPAVQSRALLAQALLAAGDRDGARAETVRAWSHATTLGAAGVAGQVGAFARRNRFTLPAAAGAPSPLDVLTPREREVLGLLADGASNRAIAERLFISTKTAGVHVSNLLAKLGVGSRLEAAAVAHRAGLDA